MLEMRRRRANILPHRPATALVATGPFAVSCNPIWRDNDLALTSETLALHLPVEPEQITTDGLASYESALRALGFAFRVESDAT